MDKRMFEFVKFSSIDLNDVFFDSLKQDYLEFEDWFNRKAAENDDCCIVSFDDKIEAFLYVKVENEELYVSGKNLGVKTRGKIGTLKIGENIEGRRIGEGLIARALSYFALQGIDEIYLTVFSHHSTLISILEKFGFKTRGENNRHELVMIRNKEDIVNNNGYGQFPYIDENKTGFLLAIEQDWHDTLFPNAELAKTEQFIKELDVVNGVTKMFVGTARSVIVNKCANVGDLALVYRKSEVEPKKYKSCATTIAMVSNKWTKSDFSSLEEFKKHLGNKTVLTDDQINNYYVNGFFVLQLIDLYSFGKGNNITYNDLKNSGVWGDSHPYKVIIDKNKWETVFKLGRVPKELII